MEEYFLSSSAGNSFRVCIEPCTHSLIPGMSWNLSLCPGVDSPNVRTILLGQEGEKPLLRPGTSGRERMGI